MTTETVTIDQAPLLLERAVLKAALFCASDDPTRYYIQGALIDPAGYVVATDGHRMFVAKFDPQGDLEPDQTRAPFEPFIIHRDTLKRALSAKSPNPRINVSPTEIGDTKAQIIEASYPGWRLSIPRTLSDDPKPASYNPLYLADFAKAATEMTGERAKRGASNNPGFTLHQNGNNPALITFSGREDCLAVLMPYRSDASDPHARAKAARIAEDFAAC